jgi:tRNA (cmo5U34)-methyltransferase
MLTRAAERIGKVNAGRIRTFRGDLRTLDLLENHYDAILAAAVLHHLRDDEDWEQSFAKLFRLTAPGGGIWITDLIAHEIEAVQAMMWDRYGRYLVDKGGEKYKKKAYL